jgi:hypothetical protein
MAEDTKILTVLDRATHENQIKNHFKERFGSLRLIYSKDGMYLAVAHDRASGITNEDIYAYEKREDKWVIIGMVSSSPRACLSIVVNDKVVEVLDNKRASIASFKHTIVDK